MNNQKEPPEYEITLYEGEEGEDIYIYRGREYIRNRYDFEDRIAELEKTGYEITDTGEQAVAMSRTIPAAGIYEEEIDF